MEKLSSTGTAPKKETSNGTFALLANVALITPPPPFCFRFNYFFQYGFETDYYPLD